MSGLEAQVKAPGGRLDLLGRLVMEELGHYEALDLTDRVRDVRATLLERRVSIVDKARSPVSGASLGIPSSRCIGLVRRTRLTTVRSWIGPGGEEKRGLTVATWRTRVRRRMKSGSVDF